VIFKLLFFYNDGGMKGCLKRFVIANFCRLQKVDFTGALPNTGSIAVAVAAAGVIRAQSLAIDAPLVALVKGGAVAAVFAVAMLAFERRFVLYCYRLARPITATPAGINPKELMTVGKGKDIT